MEVKDLKENKNLSITQIAKITGRARSTIYKVLKEELNYVPYHRLVKKEIYIKSIFRDPYRAYYTS